MKKFKMWIEDNLEEILMSGIGICGLTAGYILGHDKGYTKALRDVKEYLQKEELKKLMTINEYLKAFATGMIVPDPKYGDHILEDLRPCVVCADGFDASIQASYSHYCSPRISQIYIDGKLEKRAFWVWDDDIKTDEWEDYTNIEIGFPSEEVPEWLEYAEDPGDPTGTVYGCVPVEIVDAALEKHGGIDIQKTYDAWVERCDKYPEPWDQFWRKQISRTNEVFQKLLAAS